jgi:hypothetical protein
MFRVASRVMGYVGGVGKIGKHTIAQIRQSPPYPVGSFMELTKRVASITYNNPQHHMFFRGQGSDHAETMKGTTLYPSIFRGKGVTSAAIGAKFRKLQIAEDLLLQKISKMNFVGKQKLTDFQELRWAILQHYQVCDTPVLDITSSLRVAVSFALGNNKAGILYVLGLPAVDSSITYEVEERMFNVQLSRICPPRAYRPFFQEAFLVGDYPKSSKKTIALDFARRLITKFRLDRSKLNSSFPIIGSDYLFPDDQDIFYKTCEEIRRAIS